MNPYTAALISSGYKTKPLVPSAQVCAIAEPAYCEIQYNNRCAENDEKRIEKRMDM